MFPSNQRSAALSILLLLAVAACDGPDTPPFEETDPDAPVVLDAAFTTEEDVALEGVVEATDPEGAALTFALDRGPTHGTVSLEPDGAFVYAPAADYSGSDLFTFVASNARARSKVGTARITVTPVNDAPQITGQKTLSTDEDVPLLVTTDDLTIVDPDSTGHTIQVQAGDLYSVDEDGSIRPAAEFSGRLSVVITVTDSEGAASEPFTLEIDVIAVDDPPTVVPANPPLQTLEETSILLSLANVELHDPDSDTFTLTVVDGANYAHDGNGNVTPAVDFNGDLLVNVIIGDGVNSVPATVLVQVLAVNDAPVITGLVAPLSFDEDTTLTLSIEQFDVFDPDNGSSELVLAIVEDAVAGYSVDGLSITPLAEYSGPLSVTVTVSDSESTSAPFTFTVTVVDVNDPPEIIGQKEIEIDEDTSYEVRAEDFEAIDVDHDFPADHTVSLLPGDNYTVDLDDLTGATFTPAQDFAGELIVFGLLSDAGGASAPFELLVTVREVNDAPTVSPIADHEIDEDGSLVVSVTIGDVDTSEDLLVVVADSSNDSLVALSELVVDGVGALRTVRITPAPDQSGTTVITLTVSDGSLFATTQFLLTVNPVNDAPTLSSFADVTTSEGQATASMPFTVDDIDSDVNALVFSATSTNPTLVPVANMVFGGSGKNRTLVVTPATNRYGSALITVTVSDGAASASRSFTITVTAVDDAPTVSAIGPVSTDEDTPTGAIAFTVDDIDTAFESLVITATSSDKTLVPDANLVLGGSGANRTLTATPAANQFGVTTITISVFDGTSTVTRQFVLTVNSVNDLPTISTIGNKSTNEDASIGPIAFTVGDVETAAGSLVVQAASSNTTLVPTANIVLGGSGANRTLTITPAANQHGSTLITLTVKDADGGETSTSFTLTVDSVNDAPTLSAITNQTTNEDIAKVINFTVTDVDTPVANLTLTATSTNTTLLPGANIVFGGSGANRAATLTPAANQYGTTTIQVTVSDGSAQASSSFTLTVTAVNDPPSVTSQKILKTHADTPLALVIGDFTVTDNPGAPGEDNTPFGLSVRAGTNYTFSGNTITPTKDFVGTLTVNIRVTDSGTPPAFTDSTATVTVYDYIKDDSFSTPGNTKINNMDVRANDPNEALAITSFTAATTPAGGTVTRTGDLFHVDPPVGLGNSTFTFSYTVADADGFTDTATVTVTTGALVWYVNAAAAAGGDGRYTKPFQTVSSAATASNTGAGGQTIYVYGHSSSYSGATLSNAQKLIGQGVDFFPTPNPNGVNPFIVAGATPKLSGAIALTGGPFEVAGLNATNSPGAGIKATLSNQALTLRKVQVLDYANTGLQVLNGSTLTASDVEVRGSGATSGRGIHVDNMSGKVSFTGTNSSTSKGGASIEITNAGSVDATFSTAHSTGGSHGVIVRNTVGTVSITNLTATSVTDTGLALGNVGGSSPFAFTVGQKFTHTGGQRGVDVVNHNNGSITLGANGALAGAGVSIAGVAQEGIRLNRATNVKLKGLSISNTGNDGLQIVDAAAAGGPTTVTGLSIINAKLTDTGTDYGHWGLDFGDGSPSSAQLAGIVTLSDVTITRPGDGGMRLVNAGGNIGSADPMIVSNLKVEDAGTDGHGVLLRALGTSTVYAQFLSPEVTHTHGTRMNYAGDGINAGVAGDKGGKLDLVVQNGVFRNTAFGSFPTRGDNAIRLTADGKNTSLTFDLDSNTIERWQGHSISVDVGGDGTGVSAEGFIRNNTIGLTGVAGSGSETGNGIELRFDGDAYLPPSATMTAKVAITGNTIRNTGLNGVQVQARDATNAQQRLDLVLENNTVASTSSVRGYDIRTVSNTSLANVATVCAEISGNTLTGTTSTGHAMRVGVTAGAKFFLPEFVDDNTTAVASYLIGRGNSAVVSANAAAGSQFTTTAACAAPAAR